MLPSGTGESTDENHGLAGTRPLFQILPLPLPALAPAVGLLAAGGVRGQTSLLLQAGARFANPAPVRTRPDDSRLSPDRLASSRVGGVAARARRPQLIGRPGGIVTNPPGPSGLEEFGTNLRRISLTMGRDAARRRQFVPLSAVLVGVALVWACGGDSPTAPAPQPDRPRPTTVTVSPATAELTALGTTVQLTAEVRDQNVRIMPGATVSWTSGASSVAAVSASGLVTAVGEGVATITASAGEASGSAMVTVAQAPDSVAVYPATATITALGDTLRLVAQAFDTNGHAVASAGFSWESSADSVATVSTSGLVTAVGEGVTTITASSGEASGPAVVTVAQVVNPDRSALVALYEATDGRNWLNSENWLTDAPLGEWYGVDTDAFGRVVRLDLSGAWDSAERRTIVHGLSGPIPPELSNLSSLTGLHLQGNQLDGPIPPELGDLANLRSLLLWSNELSGPIPPELGRLADLESLDVYDNDLSGPIPPELGELINLTRLQLGSNSLTGPIPSELGELTSLTWLSLSSNSLTGSVPSELGRLAELQSLYLGGNDLSGPVPSELGELTSLTRLQLSSNSLTGSIPSELGSLAGLKSLHLGYNDLSGPIPPELGTHLTA